jgi:sulfonate transport system substrate-binding protein
VGLDPHSLNTPSRRRGALPEGLFQTTGFSTIGLSRRRFMSVLLGAGVAAGLVACGSGDDDETDAPAGQDVAALLPSVPPGTRLTINGVSTKLQLELAGLSTELPFEVPEWTNLSGGPDVINGFRSGSVDIASNAGIPPIQAHYIGGIDARIVAVRLTRVPTYVFATRPGSDIQSVEDFAGKKLAFSQGQAQGIVLLRSLDQVGLTPDDVELVELNSPQFLTALQAGQVDVAPLQVTAIYQYLNQYGKDGAREIKTDVIDRLSILWAPGRVLSNQAKASAVAAYIPIWARGAVWQHENPDIWVQKYYVEDQGITAEQGKVVVEASSKPLFPPTWDEAIQWEQETLDLMAAGGFVEKFDASILFDRRFEGLASNAVSEEYRS